MTGASIVTPARTGSLAGVGTEPASERIAVATRLGPVRLTVSDLGRARAFYEQVLGLRTRTLGDDGMAFGPPGPDAPALVELRADAFARRLDRRATGLFHLAILLPSRADLGHALLRIAQRRWPLDGASDHLVSEALYLSDPDGNGIELYHDRPRSKWRYDGGALQMATLPLDLGDVAGAAGQPVPGAKGAPPGGGHWAQETVPAGTTIGHVHLQVADLRETEAFYHGLLGFDVVVRGYPGALFVSAGGYHHHIGLNTWNSRGSGPPSPGSIGLRSYAIVLPDADELKRVLARLRAADVPVLDGGGAASA
ncbi:MAG: VOC family protein, partial [Solirubrobacteraceae bacterium]